MFGGTCDLFVPSPGTEWDGMACKSCSKPKRDHKELPPSTEEQAIAVKEVGAPVIQPAIVIPRPNMSDNLPASTSFSFPSKQDDSLRARFKTFQRQGCNRERKVIAIVVGVVLLLIIILAAALSGSGDLIVGLTADEQMRLNTANTALNSAALRLEEGNFTLSNTTDSFVETQAMTALLDSMGLTMLEFSDTATVPFARTCTTNADCQSCSDINGVCDQTLGRCSLANYDAGAENPDITGTCASGSSNCNPTYTAATIPKAITELFQGFPTRKKYEIDAVTDDEEDDGGDNAGGLEGYIPSKVYYSTLYVRGFNFSTTFMLFVPNVHISPAIHIALRVEVLDTSGKQFLHALLPVLNNLNIPGYAQFEICKGAIVFTSTSFTRMGFELVRGANLLVRTRVPSSSPLTLLDSQMSPATNQRIFNLRLLLGQNHEGETGKFLDFQKDPDVVFNTKTSSVLIEQLGIQMGLSGSSGVEMILGTNTKFNFSKNLQLFGGMATTFTNGDVQLKGYANKIILPSIISPYITMKKIGFTLSSSLPVFVAPRDIEVVGEGNFRLGNLNLDLYLAGRVFSDGGVGFTTQTSLNQNEEKAKILKLNGNSLSTVLANIPNMGNAITFLNKMSLPINLQFTMAVANRDMIIESRSISAGLTVAAKIGFSQITFPSELKPVLDFINIGTQSEVGIGVTVPFDRPNDIVVFVSFATSQSGNSTNLPVVQFEEFSTSVKPAPPSSVELAITLQLNFPGNTDASGKQRPLKLVASGAFQPPNFVIQGALIGEWKNVLGIKGLDIINAGGLVGYGATGVTAIGAWGTVDLGLTTNANFTIVINPAAGQFAWDTHLNDLSFATIFQIAQKLTGRDLGISTQVLSLLYPISIDALDITVCPVAFSIGGRSIAAGFRVNGTIGFLGATVGLMGAVENRQVTIAGNQVTLKDIVMGFGVYNVNILAPVTQLIDFATIIMTRISNALSKLGRVCVPQVCKLGICTPGPCADTPLKSQISSVMSQIRASVNSLLRVTAAEVTDVSVWDLLNGGGPQMRVETKVAGRTFSATYQVNTNFFIQSKISEALPSVAEGAKRSLQASGVVDAVLSNFCGMLNPKLCHDFGALGTICLPSLC